MSSFVRFDGMCTCAPDMYLSDTTQACAKCPSGLQKENYGTEYADCIAVEPIEREQKIENRRGDPSFSSYRRA